MPERVAVRPRLPAQTGLTPPVGLHGLLRSTRPLALEPVDVEEAVEVVVLVLEHPGEPSGGFVAQVLTRQVLAGEDGALPAPEREGLPRHGQAPLDLLVGVGVTHDRLARGEEGVDHHAARRDAVLVAELPGEDPQADPDLRRRQAHSSGRVHRLEHVGDEVTHLIVDDLDRLGAAVEDGLPGDDDGTDGHTGDSSRAAASVRTRTPGGGARPRARVRPFTG